MLRRNLKRPAFLDYFAKLPPTLVVLEACGGSHHWGRKLQALGHEVMLIPQQYVTPFVKRGKNDQNDFAAICTAAGRPEMPRVPVRPAQDQADSMLLSIHELLTGQRTQLINAFRGHAAEFGLIAAKGGERMKQLVAKVAEPEALPETAAVALAMVAAEIDRIDQVEKKLIAQLKASPMSKLLAEIPGVGWVSALTLSLRVDPSQFRSGRHLSAWLGLMPQERSTGGKQRLGAISRAGNERMRSLLVLGATAVIRHAKPGRNSAWPLSLLDRKPRKLAAVALANKIKRVAWAMMVSGEAYRQPAGA